MTRRAALALVLLPFAAAANAPQPPVETLAPLRAALGQSVQSLKAAKASVAEVDAAEKAAAELEGALLSHAPLEPQDKAYAKVAQAARRELAGHKAVIAQRGQPIRDREQRVALRKAIDHLNANAQHPPGKVLTVEELRIAEAALVAMKEEMNRSRGLAKRDRSVAATLSFMDTAVHRHEIGFDEFWILELDARRKALADAKTAPEKEAAIKSLAELLDETKKSYERSEPYRLAADRARAELLQRAP